MPASCRLYTLGRPRLVATEGNDIAFPQMGLIVLAFLKATGLSSYPRADIAMLLWGDADPRQAYANLRKTISRILSRQSEIDLELLSFSKTEIALGADAVDTDLDDLLINSPTIDKARAIRLASGLRKEFLQDARTQSKALAAWIDREREAHLAMLRRCVLEIGVLGDDPGNRSIKDAAIRLLERNPSDEAIRELLRGTMFQMAGNVSAAVARRGRPPPAPLEDMTSSMQRLPRLVLLPPLAGGAGHDIASFAAALIEDVTIGLCSMRSVSVVAPYSAAKIRHQTDKAATYERHAISYILDTRLTREGGHYSLFAQLIFFGSDEVVWAERFELDGAGLIRSRRDLAYRLAAAISQQIHVGETIRSNYEHGADVYRRFLRGQSHLMSLSLPEIRRAKKNFRDALQINPEFAPAQSGLSRSYFLEWLVTARNDAGLLSTAEQHARSAIAADPHLSAGYKELGVAKLYRRQFDESAEFFQTAESLSPHYANLIASFGDALIQGSRPEEGLKKVEHAIELNPIAPDEYFWTAAGACYSLGRYEDALDYIGRMEDRTPADRLSAASWGMLGDVRKARQFVRKTFDVHPTFDLDTWMALVPFKEEWQRQHYKEGLIKAGF
jgi:tetratricopeptide (TPR) repeat protein